MRRLTIWLAAAAACVAPAMAQAGGAARTAARPTHRVGFHVFDKWSYPLDDGSAKPLVTAVWYPASRTRKLPSHTYATGITGLATRGALPMPGDKNRPLIVFTHAYGGSGISAVYLMEHLASHGYVVAAPDHNDAASWLRITARPEGEPPASAKTILRGRSSIVRRGIELDREKYAYRISEIKTVIDKMLAENKDTESVLAGMIDPERIGLFAHGLGGFAAMSMMGMSEDHTEKRIKAAVLFSPTISMWEPEQLYDLTAPVMCMYGEKEADLRNDLPAPAAVAYEAFLGPKWSVELKRGHGMAVCNTATVRAAGLPSQVRTFYALHKMIGNYSEAMFALNVRGQKFAAERLSPAQAKKDAAWVKGVKSQTVRQPRPEPVEEDEKK